MAKLKGFSSIFDKIDQTFAKNAFSIQQMTSEIAETKVKFSKIQKERTEKEIIDKIQCNNLNLCCL